VVLDIEAANPDVGIDIGSVTTKRRRRCGEGAILPGDEVVTFGRAVERPGDRGETDVVITGGENESSSPPDWRNPRLRTHDQSYRRHLRVRHGMNARDARGRAVAVAARMAIVRSASSLSSVVTNPTRRIET
jgi:hypothetical protein